MGENKSAQVQRWTAKNKSALIMKIIKGERSFADAARAHGLAMAEVQSWTAEFLQGAGNALRSRPQNEEGMKEEQIKPLKQKIGDLVMDIDILKEAHKPYLPPMPASQTSQAGDPRRFDPQDLRHASGLSIFSTLDQERTEDSEEPEQGTASTHPYLDPDISDVWLSTDLG